MQKWRFFRTTAISLLAVASVGYAALAAVGYTPTSNDFFKVTKHGLGGSYGDSNFFTAVAAAVAADPAVLPCEATAPTVSGFGTNAAVSKSGANCTAKITVGTTASINGTVILPVATDGWACSAQDTTSVNGTIAAVKQIGGTSNTAIVEVFDTNTAASNFAANDVLLAQCSPY